MKKASKLTPDKPWVYSISMVNCLVRGAALTALLAAGTAVAQQTAPDPDERTEELTGVQLEGVVVTGTLIQRDGYQAPTSVECVSGYCPVSTSESPTVNDNHIPSITYFDLGFNYDFDKDTAFLTFQNVFDTDRPQVATTSFWAGAGNMRFFDRSGRILRVGLNY